MSKIAGWVVSVLITALFLMSAGMKLGQAMPAAELEKMGYSPNTMMIIGGVELVIALMYLFPRLSFLGAVLLTAYMGGAVETHVRLKELFIPQIIIAVVMWVGLGLRNPAVFRLAFGSPVAAPTPPAA